MQKVWQVMSTSEFWGVLAQFAVEAFNAPVPDEMKAMAWVYIGLRVVSKVAQYIFPTGSSGFMEPPKS